MYKVALVEDEYWALAAIAETFQWDEYGFSLVIQQTNPQEALTQILEQKPDVVISDIQMPCMTGFELMTQIRQSGFHCELVILSGYSDFEYARTAISLEVFDYCVKPVDKNAANQLLQRLRIHLDAFYNRPQEQFEILELPRPRMPVRNLQFQKLIDFINTSYDQQMHITKLSKRFFLNTSYCCKLFQQVFGSNFGAYVIEVRMIHAKKKLAEGISVKETAQAVGYTDYFYFTKAFKNYCGCTPTEFRKLARERHLKVIIKEN